MAINLFVGLMITSYAVNNHGLEVYGAWSILMILMLLGVIGEPSGNSNGKAGKSI